MKQLLELQQQKDLVVVVKPRALRRLSSARDHLSERVASEAGEYPGTVQFQDMYEQQIKEIYDRCDAIKATIKKAIHGACHSDQDKVWFWIRRTTWKISG